MTKDSLGDRMKKNYENRSRFYLIRRMPVILRLDGKAFHTLTRGCVKPFDENFSKSMVHTTYELMRNIQGAKVAYTQSDEISILLTDFDTLTTGAWFDYDLRKICSVSASIASVNFSSIHKKIGYFDCRAFNLPKEEVHNYFLWRFNDWVKNSLSMLAQAHFSHKSLQKKNQSQMHNMLMKKGINWAKLDPVWKNGTFVFREEGLLGILDTINLKTQKNFIDIFLETEEE